MVVSGVWASWSSSPMCGHRPRKWRSWSARPNRISATTPGCRRVRRWVPCSCSSSRWSSSSAPSSIFCRRFSQVPEAWASCGTARASKGTNRTSRSPTSPVRTKPWPNCRRSRSSSPIPSASTRWAPRFPGACCCTGHPEPERPCSPAPSRARPECPSTPSPPRSSWRCTWAWGHRACASSSSRRNSMPPR